MSNLEYDLIAGNIFKDERGSLAFLNEFSLKSIVRFYEITPENTSIIRAWQGHKKESKWFYCTQGAFEIKLIKLDDFENPSNNLQIHTIQLDDNSPRVLKVPGGYVNGFKSLKINSKLMVFSDFDLEASKNDDYRYEQNKWLKNW